MINYAIRPAIPDDRDLIYQLKAASIHPYVEKIWGWDEEFQQNDFDRDFAVIRHFHVIEIEGKFAGFLQCCPNQPYLDVAEIHLIPEYCGKGIGSDILLHLQKYCIEQNKIMRIGCFKENTRAKALYRKLDFVQTVETETHDILEYPN